MLFSTEHISQTCKVIFLQDVSELCSVWVAADNIWST